MLQYKKSADEEEQEHEEDDIVVENNESQQIKSRALKTREISKEKALLEENGMFICSF